MKYFISGVIIAAIGAVVVTRCIPWKRVIDWLGRW